MSARGHAREERFEAGPRDGEDFGDRALKTFGERVGQVAALFADGANLRRNSGEKVH